MNLIIDIGNTAAKVALFDGGEMVEVLTESNQSLDCLEALCAKYPVEQGIVATVIDLSERVLAALVALPFPLLWLDSKTPLPVTNLYETPETLGYDRMAAVVGANEQYPRRDILVIDAGTCITYEFIDSKGQYHGGNISPGMQMRFKALNQFTGRLPLIDSNGRKLPMGRDTETAIRAGVLKGMEYEISGYIESGRYCSQWLPEWQSLKIIQTLLIHDMAMATCLTRTSETVRQWEELLSDSGTERRSIR